jgi:peptidyl-prolyl cis-trans isomerase D
MWKKYSIPRIYISSEAFMAKKQPSKVISKKHIARMQKERQQIRIIMYAALSVVVVVIGLIGYGVLNQTVFQNLQPVANVNGEKITTKSFEAHVRLTRQQMITQYQQYYQFAQMFGLDPNTDSTISNVLQQIQLQLNDSASLGESVINQMIDNIIIRQEAKKRGIIVSSEEVNQAIQDAFGYFPNGTPTPTTEPTSIIYPTLNPTERALVPPTTTPTPNPTATLMATSTQDASATSTTIPTITPTATPYTQEGFQADYQNALDNYKVYGFSEADVRQLFEDDLYRTKLYAEITSDVPHTSEEVWARHILVADESTANKVRDLLVKGGDWTELALEYSNDTGSASNGGDLGWFPRGKMVAEFEDSAFNLEVGEISQPIKSQFGYHIIQVIGHDDRPLSADEYKTKTDQFFTDWVAEIRSNSDLTIYDYYKDRIPTDPALQ